MSSDLAADHRRHHQRRGDSDVLPAYLEAVEKQTGKTPQQIVDRGPPRLRGRRPPRVSAKAANVLRLEGMANR